MKPIVEYVADWPEKWRELFEERAAIMELDGGLSREVAEQKAFAAVYQEQTNAKQTRPVKIVEAVFNLEANQG